MNKNDEVITPITEKNSLQRDNRNQYIEQITAGELEAQDEHTIHYKIWTHGKPDQARGVIHLLHGMAEHINRYDHFARTLCKAGFIVYAHNHRGHGETCPPDSLGIYSSNDGWQLVQDDVRLMQNHIRTNHPNKPIILFGHSMGSYIATQYLITQGANLSGAILSGTNYSSPWLYHFSSLIVQLERLRLGATGRSSLMEALTFGKFNKEFKPNRTQSDWLSRDEAQVDRYISDPLCGFPISTQLWLDFFQGLASSTTLKHFKKVPNTLPLYVFGGAEDPTNNKTGLNRLVAKFRESGSFDVQCRVYPNGRHEMLNDINQEEVYNHVLQWLNQRF